MPRLQSCCCQVVDLVYAGKQPWLWLVIRTGKSLMLFSLFSCGDWCGKERQCQVLHFTRENYDGVATLNLTHSAHLTVESLSWITDVLSIVAVVIQLSAGLLLAVTCTTVCQYSLVMPLPVLQYPALLVSQSSKTVCQIDFSKLSGQDEWSLIDFRGRLCVQIWSRVMRRGFGPVVFNSSWF